MEIVLLEVRLRLHGCSSLKEKRRRIRGIRERLGRREAIAVMESGDQDDHRSTAWTFVVLAASARRRDQVCEEIERDLQTRVDAEIVDLRRTLI